MYLLIGAIISLILTVPSYWWFSFDKISPWYSFILIPICITYFVIYINIYWVYLLIHIHKYKGKQFVGKVSTYNLSHVRSLSSFLVLLQGLFIKRKGFKDIAKELGLGDERIRQIRKGAVKKLQKRCGKILKTLL